MLAIHETSITIRYKFVLVSENLSTPNRYSNYLKLIKIMVRIFFLAGIAFNIPYFLYSQKNNEKNLLSKFDTLWIDDLDMYLLGRKYFNYSDSINNKQFSNKASLFSFHSNNYYYVFYNSSKAPSFLHSAFWDKRVFQILNSSKSKSNRKSNYKKIIYNDGPFMTGFYNSNDSIIIASYSINIAQNDKAYLVNYFSTTNSVFDLNGIRVTTSVDTILKVFNIKKIPYPQKRFNIVLTLASTQIRKSWYREFDCCYTESYPIAIKLSIVENKLMRIEYFSFEFVEFLYKQRKYSTKNFLE
jgi:hypothetical protein